ncbi:MAG: S8 family serine peptidase [Pseudomonadota bacterium]
MVWTACRSVFPAPETLLIPAERQVLITIENPFQPSLGGAASTWQGWNWAGGYRVSLTAEQTAEAIGRDYRLRRVTAWPISLLEKYCVVFEIADDHQQTSVIRALSSDSRVALAQPLNEFSTLGTELPKSATDPYHHMQHALVDLDIEPVHAVSTGNGIRIAIIDTGIDIKHPEFSRRIVDYEDFVERAGDEFADDLHGTAVAGVIAATRDNGIGIVGVAPKARLLAYKACWPEQEGMTRARCNSLTLAKGLAAAEEKGALVVNLSLTGPVDPLLAQLTSQLIERGITIVGTSWHNEARHGFPANVPGVIGATSSGNKNPKRAALPAPGDDIISTAPAGEYRFYSGASFATAHVSGIVALQKELSRKLKPEQSAAMLQQAVQRAPSKPSITSGCRAVAPLLPAQLSCADR